MNNFFYFQQHYPYLYRFFEKKAQSDKKNPESFLFYGADNTGKEWAVIQIMKMLNCKTYLTEDHDENCLICEKINGFKSEYNIYSLLTHCNTQKFQTFLLLKETHQNLDFMVKSSFLHEIYKVFILIEEYLVKKLSAPKIAELVEILQTLIKDVSENKTLSLKSKETKILLENLELLQSISNVEYTRSILNKLYKTTFTLPYKILIVKDPALLKNDVLDTLLKTVEEPPEDLLTFFISTQHKKISPTIKSRCMHFHFKPYSAESLKNLKEKSPLFPISLLEKKYELYQQQLEENHSLTLELEKKKNQYLDISPLDKERKKLLESLLLGVKEYNLNKDHVENILNIINKPSS